MLRQIFISYQYIFQVQRKFSSDSVLNVVLIVFGQYANLSERLYE